jgi:hypothetical protein
MFIKRMLKGKNVKYLGEGICHTALPLLVIVIGLSLLVIVIGLNLY